MSRPPCAHFSLSSEESRDNKDFSFSRGASTHFFRAACAYGKTGRALCVAHVASFFSKLKYTSQGVRLSCAPEIPTLQGLITLHPRAANQLEMRSRLLQRKGRAAVLSARGERLLNKTHRFCMFLFFARLLVIVGPSNWICHFFWSSRSSAETKAFFARSLFMCDPHQFFLSRHIHACVLRLKEFLLVLFLPRE